MMQPGHRWRFKDHSSSTSEHPETMRASRNSSRSQEAIESRTPGAWKKKQPKGMKPARGPHWSDESCNDSYSNLPPASHGLDSNLTAMVIFGLKPVMSSSWPNPALRGHVEISFMWWRSLQECAYCDSQQAAKRGCCRES